MAHSRPARAHCFPPTMRDPMTLSPNRLSPLADLTLCLALCLTLYLTTSLAASAATQTPAPASSVSAASWRFKNASATPARTRQTRSPRRSG